MKKILTMSFILSLTACGSNPNKVVAVKVGDEYYKTDPSAAMALESNSEEKVICKRRIVTGSNKKQKICTTKSQMERDRENAKYLRDRNINSNSKRLIDTNKGN